MEIILKEIEEMTSSIKREEFLFSNYIWYKTLKEGIKDFRIGFIKIKDIIMPFGYKKMGIFYSIYFSPYTTPYIFKQELDFDFILKKLKFVVFIEIVDFCKKLKENKNLIKIKNFYYNINLKKEISEIEKNYKKSLREQIRQAKRKGVYFRKMREEDLLDFYKIYEKLMKFKYKKKPSLPFSFISSIYKNLFPEWADGFIAEIDGKIKSAVICLHPYKNFSLAFIQGTDPDYYSYRPSSFIFSEIIRYYKEKNFEKFSFGLTPPESSGTLFFKESFGCEKEEVYIYRFISPFYKIYEKIRNLKF
ncbi:MAG: GNAT family N-acetyltransferase [candidate division WOR-3 bacterium]